eukprot:TRINITY_DN4481_c0_g1_i1.p1 TRINITY_DN4481_c0_g1~~TRINITY_DN4481_c0_g1_i1.p1  ORF type:complete len:119 (+),score=10.74 TRINITY_DN4481_c0_g1_i1:76-432(+)
MADGRGWSTGFCAFCSQPGGCGLALRACICPCTVVGDINLRAGGPGGFLGGCLGTLCGLAPCCMAVSAPLVAEQAGFEESGIKACCLTLMPWSCCCYMTQVFHECRIKGIEPKRIEPN